MISSVVLFSILFSPIVQVSTVAVKQKSQAPKSAAIIVIGAVSHRLALVRPAKMSGSVRNLPNGQVIVEIPKPSEYIVGMIYQFRIDGKEVGRVGQFLNVFVPGPGNVSDVVAPSSARNYLLQLSLLNHDTEQFKETAIMDLADLSALKLQFDPNTTYIIKDVPYAAVPLTEDNKQRIKSIRRDARDKRLAVLGPGEVVSTSSTINEAVTLAAVRHQGEYAARRLGTRGEY